MFYNASIDYQEGMELTREVFIRQREDLEREWELVLKTALKKEGFGVLSGFERHIHGVFTGRVFEMNGLKLTALTINGRLLSVDDDLKADASCFKSPECFVCVQAAEGKTRSFERNGIPYTAPVYELRVLTSAELQGKSGESVLPVARFYEKDGSLVMDERYIVPAFFMDGDSAFSSFLADFREILKDLLSHANLQNGEARRVLQQYMYGLSALKEDASVQAFTGLLKEIEQALDFHIVEVLGQTLESLPERIQQLRKDPRRLPTPYNVQDYLLWLKEFMADMPLILNEVVIEDHTIDPEQLKAAITAELHERLLDELQQRLYAQLHDQLLTEITGKVTDSVTGLIQDQLRPELRSDIVRELQTPLYDKLHQTLYDELYGLLRPKDNRQEDIFTPLI